MNFAFQKITLVAMCIIDWTMARVEAGVAGVTDRNYCQQATKRMQ